MHVVNSLVTIIILVRIGLVHGQFYRGDECSLKNGDTGICKFIDQCPQASVNIRRGIFPKRCGFEGMQIIVCCPDGNPTIRTTARTTSTTTTPTTTKPIYTRTSSSTRIPGEISKQNKCSLNNGNTGICKFISQCPQASANIRRGIFPKRCGFQGMKLIVCCPDDNPIIRTTARTTSTTTTPTTTKPIYTRTSSSSGSRIPGEISKQKCIEYSQYIWTKEVSPLLTLESEYLQKRECPFDRETLIVGGTAASRKEFPHIVQLGYDGSNGLQWTCGGTLISEEFVLTAAHCLSRRSLGDAKYARMGLVDLDEQDKMQQFDIIQIIPHPDYVETSHYHDIGLAKLSRKADLNSFVRPACLYTNRESPWSKVIACGWGKTDYAASESNILLKVVLELYGEETCNKTYRQQYGSPKLVDGIKDDLMICAGHSTEIRDTCQGDSGGPLQVYKTGVNMTCMYDVIGVTSFGKACGLDVNLPAVYTRVSNYLKWIEDHVWPQE